MKCIDFFPRKLIFVTTSNLTEVFRNVLSIIIQNILADCLGFFRVFRLDHSIFKSFEIPAVDLLLKDEYIWIFQANHGVQTNFYG